MKINLIALKIISACLLAGCALEPKIKLDASQMGNSEVSKVIISSMWTGDEYLKSSLNEFINRPDVLNSENVGRKMEKLGFNCNSESHLICKYSGTLRRKLESFDGTVLPGNDITNIFDVTVDAGSKPFTVFLIVNREKK
jgi:hypothetical protein